MICGGCGHERAAHEHWRIGSDCGRCHCDRYRIHRELLAARVYLFLLLLWCACATGVLLSQLGAL